MMARVREDRRTRSTSGRSIDPLPIGRALRRGLSGGLIATFVMTIYRLPIFRALPPTAEFWATYVGDGDADRHLAVGLVLHFLYGGVAGALFGPAFAYLRPRTGLADERVGLLAGIAYGLALSVFGIRVVFERLFGESLEPDEALVFHVGHLIYGLTLGTWISTREAFGEVYED
jgi:hypothetical protein